MCLIQINIQCDDGILEALPEEREQAELVVEEIVAQILLELGEPVIMDEVLLHYSLALPRERQSCSIYIRACCAITPATLRTQHLTGIELALEGKISSALMEFFGTVHVESITINCSSFVMFMA
ncbi:MAG: hypothetical protein ACJ788_04325 [Ktedonobacteraceae bacterium]